jgi:hypothetical protein
MNGFPLRVARHVAQQLPTWPDASGRNTVWVSRWQRWQYAVIMEAPLVQDCFCQQLSAENGNIHTDIAGWQKRPDNGANSLGFSRAFSG